MSRTQKARGFTGIETLVWISIFVSAMLAVTSSILYFYRTNSFIIQEADAISSSERGVEVMIGAIREAAYASNGAYPIISMAANDFVFYSDVDSDPAIERVHYFISGTELRQGIVQPTGDPPVYTSAEVVNTLSTNVRNITQGVSTFTYYDMNGALMSNLTLIGSLRFVTANVVVDTDLNKPPTPLTIRSSAGLRNLVGK